MKDLDGQDICVLGGTGSIGTALIRRILEKSSPAKIRCVSNDEYSMWQTERRFGSGDGTPLRYILKDIRNPRAMKEVLRGVDILFMLACYKHVQYVEYSPQEAVDVNVNGNMNVIEEVLQNGRVQKVVNLSTDKVCYAHSTYGLSKHLIEKMVEWASFYRPVGQQITRFANTRFGNVIGSRGSVLEHWFDPKVDHIALRDPEHVRYFMRTDDAIDLVLKATKRMAGGETFIFKMPTVRIGDLAEVVSEMTEKPIKRIPALPGETKHQWLMMTDESVHRYEDDSGFVLHREFPPVEPKGYSTMDQKPLDEKGIKKLLKEWER